MIDLSALVAAFRQRYGKVPRLFRAPGRVNLIGEHTDYNDGFVLPMAIDQGTVAAIAARPDRLLRVWSMNLDDSIVLDLDKLGFGRQGKWQDYIEGVSAALLNDGIRLAGADIAINSDVSLGGGLSSSAALEMAFGMALVASSNGTIGENALALAGQTAEHVHVGIKCGIMDQFTSIHALKGHALLLDCRSLESKPIPLKLHEYRIVICDSRFRHELASSEYNQRRNDCELGVKLLSSVLPGIHALRDISLSELEINHSLLPETIFRRCRHVISENERTTKAAIAIATGDVAGMGKLMFESHRSLRDDYQVSCRELDLLVEIAGAQPGVLGARMTGGGFGGCTVNLVEKSGIASFREHVTQEYQARAQLIPIIFMVEASQGAEEIIL
jgi:galactokinase